MKNPRVHSAAERANWGVAHARQTRTRRLSPALARAYSAEHRGVPDPAGVADALVAARSIVATLEEVQRLLTEASE